METSGAKKLDNLPSETLYEYNSIGVYIQFKLMLLEQLLNMKTEQFGADTNEVAVDQFRRHLSYLM